MHIYRHKNPHRQVFPRQLSQRFFAEFNLHRSSRRPKMEAITAQVQALAHEANESTRYQILNALRDLQYAIETPKDTFMRLYNSV